MALPAAPEITPRFLSYFWSRVRVRMSLDECWEWQKCRNHGYGQFGLHFNGKLTRFYAHRVAYTIANGDPGDLYVCHACDNKPCCNPSHLFAGTCADNIRDFIDKNGSAASSQLSADFVRELRRRRVVPSSVISIIANDVGVAPGVIKNALTGKTWKHVDETPGEVLRDRTSYGEVPFKGVSKTQYGSFIANHRGKHIGTFPTAEDAARAYDEFVVSEFSEYACTNKDLGLLQ